MRFSKPKKIETNCFILSMPFIVFAWVRVLYDERSFYDWRVWAVSVPLIYGIGVVSWYMHMQYDHYIRKKFPALKDTNKRIILKLLTNVFVMTPSVLLILFVYDYFHILDYRLQPEDVRYAYFLGLAVNLTFETLWEVIYLLEKYRESRAENDMIEQLNMTHEFENLKSQVNPHFLFNCFNTLSSLISEDKKEAEKFLDELSKVYRYLLRNNEDGVSTVINEIKFIRSYFRLLKTRYGDGLHLTIDIDKRYENYLVPSLSLQLLVENAVKHNIVSKQSPLVIEVFTAAGNKLVVNNNLQRKQLKESSTRIGLKNINAKYKLMNQTGFQVVEGENNFMVVLPLVWNEQKEETPSPGKIN